MGIAEVVAGSDLLQTILSNDGTYTTTSTPVSTLSGSRQPIAISAFPIDSAGYGVYAICNDGTIWVSIDGTSWTQVAAIPQP